MLPGDLSLLYILCYNVLKKVFFIILSVIYFIMAVFMLYRKNTSFFNLFYSQIWVQFDCS